ncbi:MAG: DUF1109 family protein [Acidobacteria bacterium]|nr:DUF1109 family protein [Acidobacteriota bacterium]
MTCTDVDQLLSEGVSVREMKLRAAVLEHMQSCRRCEDLVSWTEAPAPDPGLGELVEERIRSLIHADLKPVRPLPSTLGAIGGAFVLAGMISLLHTLTMGVRGWTALSWLQVHWLSGLFLGVILLAAISLIASIRPGSRQRVHAAIPILALAIGFPSLIGWLFPSGPREHFVADGVRCLAGGLMVAAMTAGLTYALARRGYSTNWPRTGATIGVIGGVVAILALQISCPDQEFGHLLVWHALAMLLSITGGYLAGRRTMQS